MKTQKKQLYFPHPLIENCILQFSTAFENCIPHRTLPRRYNQPEALSSQQKIPASSNFRNFRFPERSNRLRPNSRYREFVIVLVSRIQKNGTRYNDLANGKEPCWTDQIEPYLKVVPNIPVGPNPNDPFHLRLIWFLTEIFGILVRMESVQQSLVMIYDHTSLGNLFNSLL